MISILQPGFIKKALSKERAGKYAVNDKNASARPEHPEPGHVVPADAAADRRCYRESKRLRCSRVSGFQRSLAFIDQRNDDFAVIGRIGFFDNDGVAVQNTGLNH